MTKRSSEKFYLLLGNAKSKSTSKTLLNLLLRKDFDYQRDSEALRQFARSSLLQVAGPHEVVTWLQEAALDKDSLLRARAVEEMSSFEDTASDLTSVLRKAWDDPEGIVRAAALKGIAKRTKAARELQELFEEARKDKDAHVRGIALDLWA